jgi:phospholipase/carboxylesterase
MYRFIETKGTDGAPLFFTFHGTGGRPEQLHGLAETLVPGAHVISPAGDVSENGAARFFRRTAEGVYDMDDLHARTDNMRNFITDTVARIQPAAVFGIGYSNGANILAAVHLNGPRQFDSIALMHPLIPWTPAENDAVQDTKVLITAGRRDPICPATMTQKLADWLTVSGAQVNLHWHEGGHELAESEVVALQSQFAPASGAR